MSEHDFGLRTDFYTFAPETLAAELADFEILREVGKGSMGIVYECRRKRDGKHVALKVLPPSLTLTDRALARFVKEGEVMARIEHPSIVSVYEHGTRGRLHYFAMQFVAGMTLDERLRSGPLHPRNAAGYGVQIAQALQYAHDHGVVHRDIKPQNLILSGDERVMITDFGLARETGTGSFTESGAIVGTPMYMAPEQVLGQSDQVDSRADIYGLAATLYELCCGTPPFVGPTSQAVLKQVLEADASDPRRHRADLPRPLAAIILKGLEKDPRRRYGSAQEMAEDLQRFLDAAPVQAQLPGTWRRVRRWARRRPILSTAGLAGLLVAGGLWLFDTMRRDQALQMTLESAELNLSKATSLQPPGQPPLTAEARQSFLLKAEQLAAGVLADDPMNGRALRIRARVHQRHGRFAAALADLDRAAAEDGIDAELLHDRIATLQNLRSAEHERRLEDDLTRLHELDPGPWTLGLLANHLLSKATRVSASALPALLDRCEELIEKIPDTTGPAAIARAWLLHLRGRDEAARQAARQACIDHHGEAEVHDRAAALYRRLGLEAEALQEASMARMLRGQEGGAEPERPGESPQDAPPVDTDELSRFLRALGNLSGQEEPKSVKGKRKEQ